MSKIIGWILSGLLLLVIAIGGVKMVGLSDNLQNTQGDIDSSRTEIADAQANSARAVDQVAATRSALESEMFDLRATTTQIASENDAKATQIVDFEAVLEDLNLDMDSLETAIKLLNEEIDGLRAEKNELLGLFCEEYPIGVDYSSNKTVSDRLVQFVEGWKSAEEPVSAHYWNVVWTGDLFSIHTVEVSSPANNITYIWKFTAYFEGEANGVHRNGIFWNDRQCWLALDD